MSNVLIFGPPGVGKGTQADLISKKYKLTHLSSGDLLRAELKHGRHKVKIKELLDAGKLVPDDMITEMIEKAVVQGLKKGGFLFDGYPRTLKQARSLDKFLKSKKVKLDAVINLKLSEKDAEKRILKRGQTSGRSDDNKKIIKARFGIYRTQTVPLLEYYKKQKKIINIDGRPAVIDVFAKIVEDLHEALKS